jgi:Yip1-like protein
MPAVLQPPGAPSRTLGLGARLIGVLTAPRTTYADVAARPAWFGVFVTVLAVSVVSTLWMLSTEVGRQAVVDQQLQTLEAFGQTVSDEGYQRMVRMAPYSGYLVAAGQIVGLPVTATVISGIAYAIFNGLLGDHAAFRQVFAVVMSSSVVAALRALFTTPLNYARESLSNPATLAALMPFVDDDTFGGRLLGSIDLFLIWWVLNLAIGFGVLYRRRTTPIAVTMLAVYGAIGLTIAVVRSVLAGV